MTEAEALQIVQRMGGAPTPRNVMMIMQQAPNENALLGKSLGLQGGEGMGQDTNILGKLDKLDALTTRPAATAPEVSSGMDYSGVPVATTRAAPLRSVPTRSATAADEAASTLAPGVTPVAAGTDGRPGLLTALASLLGISSVYGRSLMNKTGNDAFPRDIPEGMPETAVDAEARSLDPRNRAATPNSNNAGVSTNRSDPIDRNVAADRINEDRRPINTNKDERNAEVRNKPVNLDSNRPPVPDDSIPTNIGDDIGRTVAKVGRRLKGVR